MSLATSETPASFGDLLKLLRKRARLTQRELGLAVHYSETHITRLEGGTRQPDPVVVKARFVDALSLDHDSHLAGQLIALAEAAHQIGFSKTETASSRTNLPAHLTRFIGRQRELMEVNRLVNTHRLVTLIGAGGVGKTRLALEIGAILLGHFADGVWLVELAPIYNAAMVVGALASALGLHPTNRPALEVLIDYLRNKHILLLLDNCEHLIHAGARLAEMLERTCPKLHILSTSREPLQILGEATWRVPSLPIDESVLLFGQRASIARLGFTLTDTHTPLVEQICTRLDGIPLAIELAAARVQALSLPQIAARLDDRFRLLSNGNRTALPRHQTLRLMIDWSYNLLTGEESALLRHLSVFAGGWELESAEALYHNPKTSYLHAQLVRKSLVVMDESVESDTGGRYHLLETIRQYAHAKLVEAGEFASARQRHLELFTVMAHIAKPHLCRAEQVQWLDQLEAELDNFRAALEWVRQIGDVLAAEALVDGIWWYWFQRGHLGEGIRWVRDLFLSGMRVSDATWVKAQTWLGWMALHKGDFFEGQSAFIAANERVHRLGDPRQVHQVYWGLGLVTADFTQAAQILTEAINIAHRAGWPWEEGQVRWALGSLMRRRGDPQLAQAVLTEGLALLRSTGDRCFIAQTLLKLGLRALDRGDYVQARALLEESSAQIRELRDPVGVADSIIELSTLGVRQGDYDLAQAALQESIVLYGRVGNIERLAQCVSIGAGIAYGHGDFECAARLLGAVAAVRANTVRRFEFNSTLYEEYDRLLPAVKARLAPVVFEKVWTQGQQIELSQALQKAMSV